MTALSEPAASARTTRRLPVRTAMAVGVGILALRILGATWRIERRNAAPWERLRATRRPFVFALWHGTLLPLVFAHRGGGEVVVVSEHRDGEIIARVIGHLGLATTRGSSTRGGVRALIGLIRALGEGRSGAVTPDGPRGPRHAFQPGIIAAARRADCPIVCIGVAVDRAWRLRSWDAFVVPKPFARIVIVYGEPSAVASHDDTAKCARYSAMMHAVTDAAEAVTRA